MANEILKYDQNSIRVLAGVTDDSDQDITMLRVDPVTKRLLIKGSNVVLDSGWTKTGTNVHLTTITDNVGIGTASPDRKFHVSDAGNVYGVIARTGATASALMFGAESGQNRIYSWTTPTSGTASPLLFTMGSTDAMYINTSGDIGVNTTSPSTKFHVSAGDALFSPVSGSGIFIRGSTGTAISFNRNPSTGAMLTANAFGYQLNHTQSTTAASDYLAWQVYNTGGSLVNTNSLVMDGVGNVGIGRLPSTRLDIEGTDTLPMYLRTSSTLGNYIRFLTSSTVTKGFFGWTNTGSTGMGFLNAAGNTVNMIVTDAGNVGIGTTTPVALLNTSRTNDSTQQLLMSRLGATLAATNFDFTSGYSRMGTLSDFRLFTGIDTLGSFASATERLSVLASNGNVGIGDTNPARKLSVNGIISVPDGASGAIYLGTGEDLRLYHDGTSSYIQNTTGDLIFYNDSTTDITRFYNGATQSMMIDSAGNVGIGKTPSFDLDVLGDGAFTGTVFTPTIRVTNIQDYASNANAKIVFGGASKYIASYTDNVERIRTISTGETGFGTATPDAPVHAYGGTAMTAGWARTATLQATYPVLVFNSAATKWAGWGYDHSYGMKLWLNASSNDVPTGTQSLTITNAGDMGVGIAPTTGYRVHAYTTTSGGRAGHFQAAGTGTTYGVVGLATGAATLNYGAYFSASGATTNIALGLVATASANTYSLYSSGTARSYHEGNLGLGVDANSTYK